MTDITSRLITAIRIRMRITGMGLPETKGPRFHTSVVNQMTVAATTLDD